MNKAKLINHWIWDSRWLAQAKLIGSWSKDPRRQVGCIIVDSYRTILSTGYNGFARGIADDDRLHNRSVKNKIIVHAEANAIAAAARKGHRLLGSTVYITHNPCTPCANLLIQAGVVRVVYLTQKNYSPDWAEDFQRAFDLLQEAKVIVLDMSQPQNEK